MTTKKIVLSERSPVSIDTDNWPVLAESSDHDGQFECQANTKWFVIVRQHEDGRRIVYCGKYAGNGGQYAVFREIRGGWLIAARGSGNEREVEEETVRAIRRCAGLIERDDLGAECIGDLPAQEI
jgi:hypothetical protein